MVSFLVCLHVVRRRPVIGTVIWDEARISMLVSVRDTTPDDLAAIFRIRNDPQVAPHQYQTSSMGTLDEWRDLIVGNIKAANGDFRCSTILDGATIVGHIVHLHIAADDAWTVECGWNLTPSYWGRGVMCLALTDLFNRFFGDDEVASVLSDCFRDNLRCIRVMEKLGFVRKRISLCDRAKLAYSTRCFRWIERFKLDADTWRAQTK